MPDLDVLTELQTYLVAQGVGSKPVNPPPATGVAITTIWLYPRDGAALPRNLTKASGTWAGETTVTLIDTNRMGPPNLGAWLEETFVDVVVRSPQAGMGKLVHRSIKGLISPLGDAYGRKHWTMNDLLVEYSREWNGEQPLTQRQNIAAADPHSTYDTVAGYMFGCRRKILAGLTIP